MFLSSHHSGNKCSSLNLLDEPSPLTFVLGMRASLFITGAEGGDFERGGTKPRAPSSDLRVLHALVTLPLRCGAFFGAQCQLCSGLIAAFTRFLHHLVQLVQPFLSLLSYGQCACKSSASGENPPPAAESTTTGPAATLKHVPLLLLNTPGPRNPLQLFLGALSGRNNILQHLAVLLVEPGFIDNLDLSFFGSRAALSIILSLFVTLSN